MMPIHILLAVDSKQLIGCAVSMRSILEHADAGAHLHFHVMTSGVSARERERLKRSVDAPGRTAELSTYDIDASAFRHLLRSKIISHTTYARLLLGTVLPEEIKRCIYVDCDMLVRCDIAEAWGVALEGRTVAAVPNGDARDTAAHQRRLALKDTRYFNAGFVVTDVERWRSQSVGERALEYAAAMRERLILHDQDALNFTLQGDWVELPSRWNVSVKWGTGLSEDADAVFHFMGVPKPWDADYSGRFDDLFRSYLSRTAYADSRAWNPFGLAAVVARVRRRLPYPPSVLRYVRSRLPGGNRAD